ncbi:MAG: HAD-IIIA family hydrolase [Cyclobacteriaceae bacterium]
MNIDSSKIKMIILDVDGTLTDGGIYILESGEQFKKFNAKDGLGVRRTIKSGVEVGIISHSMSKGMVTKRAEMMGIRHCYVGDEPKLKILKEWCEKMGYDLHEIAYVGDDINDMDIISAVGISACPEDSEEAVKDACNVVLTRKGGDGAVREFLNMFFLKPTQF